MRLMPVRMKKSAQVSERNLAYLARGVCAKGRASDQVVQMPQVPLARRTAQYHGCFSRAARKREKGIGRRGRMIISGEALGGREGGGARRKEVGVGEGGRARRRPTDGVLR